MSVSQLSASSLTSHLLPNVEEAGNSEEINIQVCERTAYEKVYSNAIKHYNEKNYTLVCSYLLSFIKTTSLNSKELASLYELMGDCCLAQANNLVACNYFESAIAHTDHINVTLLKKRYLVEVKERSQHKNFYIKTIENIEKGNYFLVIYEVTTRFIKLSSTLSEDYKAWHYLQLMICYYMINRPGISWTYKNLAEPFCKTFLSKTLLSYYLGFIFEQNHLMAFSSSQGNENIIQTRMCLALHCLEWVKNWLKFIDESNKENILKIMGVKHQLVLKYVLDFSELCTIYISFLATHAEILLKCGRFQPSLEILQQAEDKLDLHEANSNKTFYYLIIKHLQAVNYYFLNNIQISLLCLKITAPLSRNFLQDQTKPNAQQICFYGNSLFVELLLKNNDITSAFNLLKEIIFISGIPGELIENIIKQFIECHLIAEDALKEHVLNIVELAQNNEHLEKIQPIVLVISQHKPNFSDELNVKLAEKRNILETPHMQKIKLIMTV